MCVATSRIFQGHLFELVIAGSLEEVTKDIDMSRCVRIERDHVVEVLRYLFQTLGNLFKGLDKPSKRCTAALGHNQPLVKV